MSDVKRYATDLAERAGWTFLQAAAPVFGAAQLSSWGEVEAAAVAAGVAGGAAVLSLAKGVLAGVRTGTASSSRKVAAPVSTEVTVVDA